MRILDERHPPAIVLGSGHTALGALRALTLAGIPTFVVCPDRDLTTHSRWYRPLPGARSWRDFAGSHAHQALESLPLEQAVLIAGADDIGLWMADIPQSPLAKRFRVSSSSRVTLETLQDKTRFGNFLSRTNIPHPRTFAIGSRDDIDSIPFDELDRVFVKPADSQQFSETLGVKGIWAKNRAEFTDVWNRLDGLGFKVIAQEYIPGRASDHYFIDGFRDRDGTLTGLFARRRLRIYPADFGNSSYCQSTPLADVAGALEHLASLLTALRYRGIFSAEFKRDARSGEFKILEVNTRAWWYVEFAARCGINVCQMAYEDALGKAVTARNADYLPGIGCVNLPGDIHSFLTQPRESRTPLPTILGEWAHAQYHVFRIDDPAPGLSELWGSVYGLMARLGRRLVAAFIPRARAQR